VCCSSSHRSVFDVSAAAHPHVVRDKNKRKNKKKKRARQQQIDSSPPPPPPPTRRSSSGSSGESAEDGDGEVGEDEIAAQRERRERAKRAKRAQQLGLSTSDTRAVEQDDAEDGGLDADEFEGEERVDLDDEEGLLWRKKRLQEIALEPEEDDDGLDVSGCSIRIALAAASISDSLVRVWWAVLCVVG
jgi:hypothetical protein